MDRFTSLRPRVTVGSVIAGLAMLATLAWHAAAWEDLGPGCCEVRGDNIELLP
jgi:hypothetical protein